ncbi:MAG: glycosyltransferase family 2 protein, partial [Acidimicrobiales bacterium]
AMRALRVLVALVSRQHLSDTSSGFRGFSGPLLEFFAANYPAEYLGDTVEAIVLAARGGFKVAEVPVRMHERTGGRASTRGVRLVYHYIRLVTVLVVTATPRRERARR